MNVRDILSSGLRDLSTRPKGNVPSLDVLRSIAILLVFCTHFGGAFDARQAVLRQPFFYWGWSGVDLFFVLSGVLIGTQLWKEMQKTAHIKVGRFLVRRGMRIWPLYFFFVASLSFQALFLGRKGVGIWADATFLSNYFRSQLGGGWSLSTEEQFYIVAAVGIAALSLILRPRRMWIIGFAIGIPVISRAISISRSLLPEDQLRQQLYFPFHTHADGLVIGLLLSWCIVYLPNAVRSPRWRWSVALTMFAVGIALYKANRLLFNFTSLGLIYGSVTLICVGLEVTPKILAWRGFYLVSRLSYGIYLNHFVVLPQLRTFLFSWRVSGGEVAFWLCLLVSFGISTAVALVTFQLIEWPFLLLRSHWLPSQPKPLPSASLAKVAEVV